MKRAVMLEETSRNMKRKLQFSEEKQIILYVLQERWIRNLITEHEYKQLTNIPEISHVFQVS